MVSSYSEFDPLCLPTELVEALALFDGRPVAEALRAIEKEKKLRLDRGLVLKLVDFGILTDAGRAG
jgi:hypothetical protein